MPILNRYSQERHFFQDSFTKDRMANRWVEAKICSFEKAHFVIFHRRQRLIYPQNCNGFTSFDASLFGSYVTLVRSLVMFFIWRQWNCIGLHFSILCRDVKAFNIVRHCLKSISDHSVSLAFYRKVAKECVQNTLSLVWIVKVKQSFKRQCSISTFRSFCSWLQYPTSITPEFRNQVILVWCQWTDLTIEFVRIW